VTPRRHASRLSAIAAVGLLAVLASLATETRPAHATGFVIPDNGTKSVGRGGAYMLGATGPEVIYYNPALLTRLKGFQLTLDLNIMDLDASFARSGEDPTTGEPFPLIENEFDGIPCCGVFPAPMLFVSHDFGLDNFGFGFAVYGPSAVGARQFPLDGAMEGDRRSPSRYMLIEAEILEIYYTLAAAWQVQGFRVGISAQLAQLLPTFKLAIHADNLTQPEAENPDFQAITTLETSGFSPTGIIGIAYDVNTSLSFGLTFQKGVDFETEGTINLEFPASLDFANPKLTNDKTKFSVSDADVLRLGARYAHIDGDRELFDVELVATWERWSRNKEFLIEPEGSVSVFGTDVPLDPIHQAKNWQDAYSVRLGGDVPIVDWLTLRTGGFYETSAIPSERTHLDFFSFDRFGTGLGATFHVWQLDIDAGYIHIFEAERTVTDGAVLAEAPINTNPRPVVNNGTYKASYDTYSVGVTYRFGDDKNIASRPAITDL